MDDEMMTISRGGCTMKIVKSTNFGVPPIVIGTHLDQEGLEILDSMLTGTATIEETVDWARNYVPRKSSAFDPSKVRRHNESECEFEEDDSGSGGEKFGKKR